MEADIHGQRSSIALVMGVRRSMTIGERRYVLVMQVGVLVLQFRTVWLCLQTNEWVLPNIP